MGLPFGYGQTRGCPHPFSLLSQAHGWEDSLVASLIDLDSNRWHSEALRNLFMQRDVELIELIPLSSIPTEDTLIWTFTPTGIYSVKSGYNFLYKNNNFNNNKYHPESNKMWKKVWGLDVQPKIRNFLWHAIKDTIPTKANLKRRRVIPADCCDHCLNTLENTLHALWSCPSLSQV